MHWKRGSRGSGGGGQSLGAQLRGYFIGAVLPCLLHLGGADWYGTVFFWSPPIDGATRGDSLT